MAQETAAQTIHTPAVAGRDARAAGWVLSVVTCLVLVVGMLVIRGARSTGPDQTTHTPVGKTEAPTPPKPRVEPIVLQSASATSDRASDDAAERR